jgi:hypothetical protein
VPTVAHTLALAPPPAAAIALALVVALAAVGWRAGGTRALRRR